jgi:tRNA dimethylallyltransferase
VTVIGIFGPTASGKSRVSEAVAGHLGGELVSADAMQVYAGLPLLTNQSPARLVAVWPLAHEASVGEYAPLAHAAIDELLAAGRTPIVVGGTGLYFRAALGVLRLPPAPPPGARERWERLYDEDRDEAVRLLRERDPRAAAIHPNDRRRIVRALELAELGATLRPTEPELWSASYRYPTLVVGLDVPKDVLDARIEERTQTMFEQGVQDEVRAALRQPLSSTARKTLGLDEVATLPAAEAQRAIVQRTRRYAAYQRKWMRRISGIVIVAADRPPEEVAADIVELARARERLPRR